MSAAVRRDESKGFDEMYLKVYEAQRPELFFKQTGRQLAGIGDTMGLRPVGFSASRSSRGQVAAENGTIRRQHKRQFRFWDMPLGMLGRFRPGRP